MTIILSLSFKKGLKSSLKDGMYTAKRLLKVLEVPASKKVAFLESPCCSSVYEKSGIANSVTVAIAGTILLIVYARTQVKSGSLSKD